MSETLPATIKAYFQAKNAHDTAAMAACFSVDAVVHDEGREHHGASQIREWLDATKAKYQTTVDVIKFDEGGNETAVTGLVSGTFDGSPAELRFRFTLENGKITQLTIA